MNQSMVRHADWTAALWFQLGHGTVLLIYYDGYMVLIVQWVYVALIEHWQPVLV
jgi:hypothetical protein